MFGCLTSLFVFSICIWYGLQRHYTDETLWSNRPLLLEIGNLCGRSLSPPPSLSIVLMFRLLNDIESIWAPSAGLLLPNVSRIGSHRFLARSRVPASKSIYHLITSYCRFALHLSTVNRGITLQCNDPIVDQLIDMGHMENVSSLLLVHSQIVRHIDKSSPRLCFVESACSSHRIISADPCLCFSTKTRKQCGSLGPVLSQNRDYHRQPNELGI